MSKKLLALTAIPGRPTGALPMEEPTLDPTVSGSDNSHFLKRILQ